MKVLLDTHVFLWWLTDSARLSERARAVILDRKTDLFWSAASSWEIAIKVGLGRLSLPTSPRILIPEVLKNQGIQPLDITLAHAHSVADLPPHHRDPFDRLLVAQAIIENLPILSADPVFTKYEREVVW